jgi:hypothetical protein
MPWVASRGRVLRCRDRTRVRAGARARDGRGGWRRFVLPLWGSKGEGTGAEAGACVSRWSTGVDGPRMRSCDGVRVCRFGKLRGLCKRRGHLSDVELGGRVADSGCNADYRCRLRVKAGSGPHLVIATDLVGGFRPSRASPRPAATPGLRRPKESHTTSVGSRKESDNPGASTEAWPGNGRKSMKQVAADKAPRPVLALAAPGR